MASKSSALRACSRADSGRAWLIALRRAFVRGCGLAACAVSLLRCLPDLDSLSRGASSGAGGVPSTAGTSSAHAGTNETGGQAQAGASSSGTAGAEQAAGGTQATGGTQAAGGVSAGAGGSTGGAVTAGAAGEAGSGTPAPCTFTAPPNALAYDAFDQGLTGEGFAPVLVVAVPPTSSGSTASVAWDSAVGRTCPGAFRLTGVFKGYSSSADKAIGDLRFSAANWSGAVALHAWVRVDPASAPLEGIQLFVVSGASAGSFVGVFDSSQFAYDTWYEMVVPLVAGSQYDPTSVLRVGLQIVLKTAGSPGIPASPPTTSAYMDDIWVEK